jgi:murein L,D-transpeptidase YcbB/YkuD
MLDDNNPLNPMPNYLLKLAFASEKHGLETGIRWNVPANLVKAIDAAIANRNFEASVKIGWDPTHVQPTGISVSEAKAGKRPFGSEIATPELVEVILKKGDSGSTVVIVQHALNISGIQPALDEDGIFGNDTDAAVKAFQQKNKLQVDGIVGPATFAALGITEV